MVPAEKFGGKGACGMPYLPRFLARVYSEPRAVRDHSEVPPIVRKGHLFFGGCLKSDRRVDVEILIRDKGQASDTH
jgi:hypothetical protein